MPRNSVFEIVSKWSFLAFKSNDTEAINHGEKYLRSCSRLNKSVMSFNDDDKDKNVVSSFCCS